MKEPAVGCQKIVSAPSGKENATHGKPPKRPGEKIPEQKKADVEKLGWGIGLKEPIARAGIDVDDAKQMGAAELPL